MIAPVQVVDRFDGGKYLIFSYNKSAKFRIDQVRGDNAVLSGLFFDSAKTDFPNHVGAVKGEYSFENFVLTSRLADFYFTTKNANDTIEAVLFDLQGRKVATLLGGKYSGYNHISHALPGLTSGLYLWKSM